MNSGILTNGNTSTLSPHRPPNLLSVQPYKEEQVNEADKTKCARQAEDVVEGVEVDNKGEGVQKVNHKTGSQAEKVDRSFRHLKMLDENERKVKKSQQQANVQQENEALNGVGQLDGRRHGGHIYRGREENVSLFTLTSVQSHLKSAVEKAARAEVEEEGKVRAKAALKDVRQVEAAGQVKEVHRVKGEKVQ